MDAARVVLFVLGLVFGGVAIGHVAARVSIPLLLDKPHALVTNR